MNYKTFILLAVLQIPLGVQQLVAAPPKPTPTPTETPNLTPTFIATLPSTPHIPVYSPFCGTCHGEKHPNCCESIIEQSNNTSKEVNDLAEIPPIMQIPNPPK